MKMALEKNLKGWAENDIIVVTLMEMRITDMTWKRARKERFLRLITFIAKEGDVYNQKNSDD